MAQPSSCAQSSNGVADESPNMLVYRKMEDTIARMQDEKSGIPIRTVKSFLSKIPSVFSGSDIVQWMQKNLNIEDQVEALHLGTLMAAHGYFFPISDHVLMLKDDGTFYRFQTPYFWPSNSVYLCKRTMQNKARLELADYEAESLARLQRAFARKWEFIFMQAEAQAKVDKKRDKIERKILDSQERAFWDVHRPVVKGFPQICACLLFQIQHWQAQLDRHRLKMSKVAESLLSFSEQYIEYDPFFTTPEPSNPWISDDVTSWDLEASKEAGQQRVKRWGFGFDEVLKDPVGREQFLKFLESEFSSENLRFWLAVQELKKRPIREVPSRVQEIWDEFLAPGAPSAINVDSRSYDKTTQNIKDPGRYAFQDAQVCVFLTGPRLSLVSPKVFSLMEWHYCQLYYKIYKL
uniref:Regulator of G-protein signaling 7-like n=1 Tax=Sinocyclocheilus anshuiensis TaxID=1608454 RepID=A0A671LNJ8_9TELE